ncbi:lymphocyte-induced maturation 1 homolog [Octopus vulgaris]|uniref:Lymphocyte-induced maturation 1 homolog n=1 Tax=Octopus vulgaris TaxID=6645 RepID=A0AA36F484_OCTVU|nr:lymphocyte-induced maturation 1 homolog [Octopus vulgaris]
MMSSLRIYKRTHTGDKPYKCEVCGVMFSQKGVLTRHEGIHSGDKPYDCEACGESFTRSGYLSRHKRKVHDGEKA